MKTFPIFSCQWTMLAGCRFWVGLHQFCRLVGVGGRCVLVVILWGIHVEICNQAFIPSQAEKSTTSLSKVSKGPYDALLEQPLPFIYIYIYIAVCVCHNMGDFPVSRAQNGAFQDHSPRQIQSAQGSAAPARGLSEAEGPKGRLGCRGQAVDVRGQAEGGIAGLQLRVFVWLGPFVQCFGMRFVLRCLSFACPCCWLPGCAGSVCFGEGVAKKGLSSNGPSWPLFWLKTGEPPKASLFLSLFGGRCLTCYV